jgi:hypothetical protein
MTKPERFARLAQIARGETCLTCTHATAAYGKTVWCEKHICFPHLHATCACWKLTTGGEKK